jgi:hypothetical protein
MAEIFICYRRDDATGFGGAIRDKLSEEFERDYDKGALIYLDVENKILDEPWRQRLTAELDSSHIVLVIIGPNWLTSTQDGVMRLEQKNDPVRYEIERAARKGKKIIPVCVGGASLPRPRQPVSESITKLLDTLLKRPAEFIQTGEAGRADEYERLKQRVWLELPPSSAARRNVESPVAVSSTQVICRYELTGLAEATASTAKDEWKRDDSVGKVPPELMHSALAFVERKLLEARTLLDRRLAKIGTGYDRQPTAEGAIFFIDAGAQPDRLLGEVAKKACEASQDFFGFVREFARRDGRGLNWVIDIRIVIASGDIWKTKGRDVSTGRPLAGYSGQPLSSALSLLRYRDRKGRPLVRRGDVVVVGGGKPQGFDEYQKLPDEWPLEGGNLMIGRDEVLGLETKVWLARRKPETSDHFRIRAPAVEMLKRRTLTTDDKAKDLLNHVPPSNYGQIAELAKTGERFCIIVGEPGAGKTLCALRLVAEMMYIDGFDVSIPPVTAGTWERLASLVNSRLVILLDDAFGKTKAVDEGDLSTALRALDNKPAAGRGGSKGKTDRKRAPRSFLEQPPDLRPALIITVRQKVWQAACRLKSWELKLDKYRIEIKPDFYSREDRIALFKNYWKGGKGIPLPSNPQLENAVAGISHPLSIRDFARECANDGLKAIAKVPLYRTDAVVRYVKQLESPGDRLMHLWHFLAWAFGGTLLDKQEVASLYELLGKHLGFSAVQTLKVWETNEEKPHWGKWEGNGYFNTDHPLREEVVDKFFRSKKQSGLIDKFFEALLASYRGAGTGESLKLAAFAAPKVNSKIGRYRRQVIQLAAKDPDSDAARVLASSIGQAFRNSVADKTLAWDPDTRSALIDALRSILASPNNAAFGVAFAALCDGFPESRTIPRHLRDLKEFALRRLEPACRLNRAKSMTVPYARKTITQNIDHSMWAIASNFSRVPAEFRELLASFVQRGNDDWLRLRAVEAAADYIAAIKDVEKKIGHNFENYIDAATDVGQPDIMRRGVAGAVEANFGKLKFAADRITEWLGSVNERHNYGFLEWVIWAAGEHLGDFEDDASPDKLKRKFADALLKLARHEDARVRKWLATALAESEVTNENNFLRSIMTRLARDDDDIVRDVALNFFLEESEETEESGEDE